MEKDFAKSSEKWDLVVVEISNEAYADYAAGINNSRKYRSSYYDRSPKGEILNGLEYAMYQESLYSLYTQAWEHAKQKAEDNTGKILGKIDLSKFKTTKAKIHPAEKRIQKKQPKRLEYCSRCSMETEFHVRHGNGSNWVECAVCGNTSDFQVELHGQP